MAGAVPASLERVPVHDAADMGARRRLHVQLPLLVAIGGKDARAVAQQAAFAGLDLVGGFLGFRYDVFGQVGCHVLVLAEISKRARKALARRPKRLLPAIVALLDQIGKDEASSGPHGHALAGIAGDDKNTFVAGIAPDEGHVIDGLVHLARPAMAHCAQPWKTRARPSFEIGQTDVGVVGQPRLVIFSADDRMDSAAGARLEAHIMIRVKGVPHQRIMHGVRRRCERHGVSPIWRLLGVNGDAIVEGRVGCDDDMIGVQGGAILQPYGNAGFILFDLGCSRVREQAPSPRFDGAREAGKIFQRVYARLVGKTQRWAGVETKHRRALGPFHRRACFAGGFVFLLQLLDPVARVREQITIHAGEIAGDGVFRRDPFDAVDGGDLTFRELAGFVLVAALNQLEIEIVEFRSEVRRGARGHASADAAAVEHDDAPAPLQEGIGNR